MIVKKYSAEVLSLENPVDALFVLSLKSKEKPFKFNPGQFLHLALDPYDPSMAWPESRCFSIQAQPNPDELVLTFSAKGAFTKRMASELSPGHNVTVKLPYGNLFSVIPTDKKCVFIAGGTGITPFISLFTHPSFAHLKHPVLYAGFKNASYNLYDHYLDKATALQPDFKIYLKYEELDGILDIAEIFSREQKEVVYYLSGPPQMIKTLREFLIRVGVDASDVRTDDWA